MKKLYRYIPPHSMPSPQKGDTEEKREAIRRERMRGHRVKIMKGLHLNGGEAMLLDEKLVKGIDHVYEVDADGKLVNEADLLAFPIEVRYRLSKQDPEMDISIPDDEEGKLAAAADAIRDAEAKAGKSVGKQTRKAADKKAVKAAIEKAKKPRPKVKAKD